MIRKVSIIVLAFVLAFSLVSCAKSKTDSSKLNWEKVSVSIEGDYISSR